MSEIQKLPETKQLPGASWEKLLIEGDLSVLSPPQRAEFYLKVCESLGLNRYTRPFEYIRFQKKLTLYARKDATDQLRSLRGISVEIISREQIGDLYVVTARAVDAKGRHDESIGAMSVQGLRGTELANELMKCETKAKRRVTLSICGLGFMDETEIEDLPKEVPPGPKPEYLPGIEPRNTAEGYVKGLINVAGGPMVIEAQIALYTKAGNQKAALMLQAAYNAAKKPEQGVSEDELLPFEK